MVVLCKGTGSVDEVFKLAGFNVVSVDWVHAFTTGKVEKDPADILLDRPQKERPRTAQLKKQEFNEIYARLTALEQSDRVKCL